MGKAAGKNGAECGCGQKICLVEGREKKIVFAARKKIFLDVMKVAGTKMLTLLMISV